MYAISNVQICTEEQILRIERERERERESTYKIPEYIMDKFKNYTNVTMQSYPAMVWPSYDKTAGVFAVKKILSNSLRKYCPQLFETVTVLCDGNVVPCCYDINGETIFGNIMDDSIFEIWNGDKHSYFRTQILNGIPNDTCKKCLYFNNEYLVKK